MIKKLKTKTLILFFSILFLLISVFFLISENDKVKLNVIEKNKISTSFFLLEEITKNIVGETLEVSVLIPYGVEPHDYDLTPKKIVEVSKSFLHIGIGDIFENVENKIKNTNKKTEFFLSYNQTYNNENFDNHIWLSIDKVIFITKNIENFLSKKYPENKLVYINNSQIYISKLKVLKKEFQKGLDKKSCNNNKIFVIHDAFNHLAKDYNFTQISFFGETPENEPSSKKYKKIIDISKKNKIKYFFSEPQLDNKIANILINDINGKILELSPIKMHKNETYFTIMRKNLKNLKIGLNCSN